MPFPVDVEPRPRPWWRRLLPGVAVVGLALAGYAVAQAWPSSAARSADRSGGPTVPGQVLVYDVAADGLARVSPDGSHRVALPVAGALGYGFELSADGRLLVTGSGDIVYLDGGRPRAGPTGVSRRIGANQDSVASVPPVAGQDRYVVQGGQTPDGSDYSLRFYDIATGKPSRALGQYDTVAGDPQMKAAWVSAPSGPPVSVGDQSLDPDSKVELRGPGITRTLVTKSQMLHASGLRAGPINLLPVPSPSGGRLAVVVTPLSGPAGRDAVVVVSRGGHVVGALRRVPDQPSWSSDGTMLTVAGAGSRSLRLWQPDSGSIRVVTLPQGPVSWYGDCVWAPDGADVLCVGYDPTGHPLTWAEIRVSDGHVATKKYAGYPVAWYAGSSG